MEHYADNQFYVRTGFSLPNGPELAGSAARVRVSAETNDTEQAFSAELSLGSEFRFPITEHVVARGWFDDRAY